VETPQIAPACPFDLRCLHSLRSVDMTFSRSVPLTGLQSPSFPFLINLVYWVLAMTGTKRCRRHFPF
ncbi:MAG: hypothetical protein LBQ78_01340, partial [Tannerellaceae bacterium]|nr:hypothetical protein [Tannerellaceae bacterium]